MLIYIHGHTFKNLSIPRFFDDDFRLSRIKSSLSNISVNRRSPSSPVMIVSSDHDLSRAQNAVKRRLAEKGSTSALGELNRVYPEYDQDKPSIFTIEINDRRKAIPAFAPFDMGYSIHIKKNGTIEYRDSNKQAVISDMYQSVKVHVKRAETITKALELAKARFAVNGFEIRNASVADLKAIQDAVNRTNVNVKIIKNQKKER